ACVCNSVVICKVSPIWASLSADDRRLTDDRPPAPAFTWAFVPISCPRTTVQTAAGPRRSPCPCLPTFVACEPVDNALITGKARIEHKACGDFKKASYYQRNFVFI